MGAKLKRNVHPEQRLGSRLRKKIKPNFGRDSGLIKTAVSVSVSGSRRPLGEVIWKKVHRKNNRTFIYSICRGHLLL
jgi:hypothetical protein